MRAIFVTAALILALFGFGLTPAIAQQAQRDAAIAACTVAPVDAASCNAAILAYLEAIEDLPAAQADALLADLVIELALAATPETQAVIGAAIILVAQAIEDPARAAAALRIAALVSAGEPMDPETADALASPS